MGMPVIISSKCTREPAITALIQSVELQEAALSHILNAIQATPKMPNATSEELLKLNKSVEQLINSVTHLEIMFQAKLDIVR